MGKYLIDNNVIANYFAGLFSENATELIAKVINETPNISVITKIEALSWQHPDKSKEAVVQSFIEDANIFTLSPDVEQCIKIRRGRKVKTPDAIIAATAIVHNFILITSDGDFKNIKGLHVINPDSLQIFLLSRSLNIFSVKRILDCVLYYAAQIYIAFLTFPLNF